MKRVIPIVLVVLALVIQTTIIVSAQGNLPPVPGAPVDGDFVVDELNWFTPEQEAQINQIVGKLDSDGIAQIGVLTKDDCGDDVTRYRYEVFNVWGIGHINKNDGLLIAVCWYGGDQNKRTVAQEVGYGLEGTLPDTLTNKVAKEVFRSFFAANQPGQGLVAMVQVYDSVLRGGNYDQAINDVLNQGGVTRAVEQPTENSGEDAIVKLLLMPICGLQCIWWLLILAVILIVLYYWAVHKGYITPSVSIGSPSSPTDTNNDGPSFGGGSSGGGGSNTGF